MLALKHLPLFGTDQMNQERRVLPCLFDTALRSPRLGLRLDFPDDAAMRVSHEAIYGALYVQGRGALRRELTQCLRTGRTLRVPRARTRGRGKSFVTPEVLISERPAEVAG